MNEPEKTGEIRNPDGTFKKGITGNPNGRPKGSYSIVELIKKKLQEIPEGKDKTYGEYFVEQVMKKSVVEGDISMMKDIINRVDGMPRQNIGLDGGHETAPIIHQFEWKSEPSQSTTAQESGLQDSTTQNPAGR